MNKKYYAVVLLTLSMGMIAPAAIVSAANQDGRQPVSSIATDADNIKPEFATSADALRAATRAKEAVNRNSSLKQSLANVENAQNRLKKAVNSDDRNAITRANQALAKAEEAYIGDLADITGVSNKDIMAMHDTGMSWGDVAHELGVHADVVGLGHTRDDTSTRSNHTAGRIDARELNEATARNMSSGWSLGHGVGVQSGVNYGGFRDDTVGISGAGEIHGVESSGNRVDTHDNRDEDMSMDRSRDIGDQYGSGSYGDASGKSRADDSDSHSGGRGDSGGSGGSSGDGGGHGGSRW